MEKYLYNAITKLFTTLAKVGYIDKTDKYKTYIAGAVYSISKTFGALVTKKDTEKMSRYIECLADRSCLLGKSVPTITYNGDSLITIVDNAIITDLGGTTLVSNQRLTRTFNDFAIKSDLESDQYVVGYDQSDNDEVAINVKDLGVFWEVDI